MPDLFSVQNGIMLVVSIALFAVKVGALVDCVSRPAAHFTYIETLPKQTWLVILGLALVIHIIWWDQLFLLNLVGIVAAFVYLAQVRGSAPR